jgi:hypothetical protein
MCECAARLESTLKMTIEKRNDAYKAFQQWEGAVSAMEQLIPILFPQDSSTTDNIVEAEVIKE